MTELLTAAQMRAIEQAAIESGDVTGLELMERAGRGVIEAVFEEWPDLANAPHKAVVLCGPGNNGGDGFVVARLLKDWGWTVQVFLYGDPAKLPPDAKVNYDWWCAIGQVGAIEAAPRFAHEADLFVDALFGTGLARPLEGAALTWATDREADPDAQGKTVAVDMPSGLCSDSGRELGHNGATVLASLTVSFHAAKLGHYLQCGTFKCGRTVVADIGLRPDTQRDKVRVVEASHAKFSYKVDGAHKYTHGHALVLTGGAGRTGAARLAARGALRIGAGLVTLGAPGSAQMEVACQITALMLRRVDDSAALAEGLADTRINALCLGPGLGIERARDLVPVAVRAEHAPYVVLDADALTAFADAPEALFGMLHDRCVLTPHGGEFARLFPDIAEKLNAVPSKGPAYSKVDATRDAAKRAGCVVLFKGPDTVIAAPDGKCAVHAATGDRAAPWLATAGAGDVLAGFITGLLARGFDPMQAAEAAAWLHVECARSFGPGLIAEDLPEELPKVFRRLGLG
ncbi:NAD(P)H-hydrate dehydratase [Roseovarius gahaiensis]|uniref:Bifunctional NAD(P)H-hydrate repair enzyme n=1 Tax=Roseovarius gahaiensis TaxID=2716691 RepID=A0A967EF51_9RHOB|nr:NAD(P)H-hydrate dehydratase [Roseovarius gahaiensis]NHQ73426.1 NAD(P)H-hydrate dehydratase [Roseovarius gahaiensis]